MCRTDDYDPWDIFHEKTRTARKTHKCGECRRQIEPGERYQHCTGLLDGDWSTHKTCEQCAAAAKWLVEFCDGYVFHEVLADLQDHTEGYDEEYLHSAPLAEMVALMESKWLLDGELMPVEQVKALCARAIDESMDTLRTGVAA